MLCLSTPTKAQSKKKRALWCLKKEEEKYLSNSGPESVQDLNFRLGTLQIYTVFNCVPLSTVISLYGLHLIALYSSVSSVVEFPGAGLSTENYQF